MSLRVHSLAATGALASCVRSKPQTPFLARIRFSATRRRNVINSRHTPMFDDGYMHSRKFADREQLGQCESVGTVVFLFGEIDQSQQSGVCDVDPMSHWCERLENESITSDYIEAHLALSRKLLHQSVHLADRVCRASQLSLSRGVENTNRDPFLGERLKLRKTWNSPKDR